MEPNLLERMKKNQDNNQQALKSLASDITTATINEMVDLSNLPKLGKFGLTMAVSIAAAILGPTDAY